MYYGETKVTEIGFEIMLDDNDSDFGIYSDDFVEAMQLLHSYLKDYPQAYICVTGIDPQTGDILVLDKIKLHEEVGEVFPINTSEFGISAKDTIEARYRDRISRTVDKLASFGQLEFSAPRDEVTLVDDCLDLLYDDMEAHGMDISKYGDYEYNHLVITTARDLGYWKGVNP